MPRKPRFYVPGVPVHIVQRGNNREATFFDDADRAWYRQWLGEAAARYDCAIHAYVLMSNHVYILATPLSRTAIARMIQHVGRRYVMQLNRKYGRSGTLWEGRYKVSLVQEEAYLLRCYRYIELNPVRAGMVSEPEAHRWSSYHCNAGGAPDAMITPHALYTDLGIDPVQRRDAYKALFKEILDDVRLDAIRRAWRSGTPLGDDRFRERVGGFVGRPVGFARRGRPRQDISM